MIYLDNNATTPLAPEVIKAIRDACQDMWANPSSGYTSGNNAKDQLEAARRQVALMVEASAPEKEITFVSGGTEVKINRNKCPKSQIRKKSKRYKGLQKCPELTAATCNFFLRKSIITSLSWNNNNKTIFFKGQSYSDALGD
jgi:hypothetical protein